MLFPIHRRATSGLGQAQRGFVRTAIPGAAPRWLSGIQTRSEPYAGIPPTLALMREQTLRAAHAPSVRGAAETVTRGVYGKDYLSELAAFHYWACDPRNLRYMRDPALVELVKDADVILATGQADCEEMDVLTGSLMRARVAQRSATPYLGGLASTAGNVDVEPALAGFATSPALTHTFVRVKDPRGSGRFAVLDPVAGPLTGRMLKQVRWFERGGVL